MEEGKLEKNLNDLIEIVSYIKDNMANKADTATKDDIANLTNRIDGIESRMATKITGLTNRIDGIESRMVTKDDIKSLSSKLDFISQEVQEIKERLNALELRTKEDDEMIIKDIMSLRDRLGLLENRIKVLESVKA
jgi:polyhydroxyalkanoate synthesis regulator phasin